MADTSELNGKAIPAPHYQHTPQIAKASRDYETREILADPDLVVGLQRDMADPNGGEMIPWEQVKRDLDLGST